MLPTLFMCFITYRYEGEICKWGWWLFRKELTVNTDTIYIIAVIIHYLKHATTLVHALSARCSQQATRDALYWTFLTPHLNKKMLVFFQPFHFGMVKMIKNIVFTLLFIVVLGWVMTSLGRLGDINQMQEMLVKAYNRDLCSMVKHGKSVWQGIKRVF